MVLDYLAAELWDIYKQIEDLELQDRNEKGLHHRMHKSDSKFGEKKEALMEKMTAKLERYGKCYYSDEPFELPNY